MATASFQQLRILLIFLLLSVTVFGQNKYILPQISPKSPNAAEFDKYGNIPVSMTNGTANISIPLYTIKVGALEIPITLSYNSNGLKTDEIPSYVGMGWSINAGGVIHYEQRGLPDYSSPGMFSGGIYNALDSLKKFLAFQMTAQRQNKYLEKLTEGDTDGEFDFYNFSFLGYSGSFYQDTNQRIVQVPASNLKIAALNTIIDEKGNRFLFSVADHNEIGPDPDPAKAMKRSFNENATYFLSAIYTADNRTISFGYGAYPFMYSTSNNSVTVMSDKPFAGCPGSSLATGYTFYQLNNNLLAYINFDGGRVEFETSVEYRNDIHTLDPLSNVPYLKKVKVYNALNVLVTEFVFNYYNGGRLVLNEVVKSDTGGNAARWKFEYIGGTDFGTPFDGGKDHWGYVTESSKGIPNANYATLVSGWKSNSPTVNKESTSNPGYSMLKKIIYPTGGSSTFTYESNSITFTSPSQMSSMPFLMRPYPNTYETIVDENTFTQDEVSGSFTLTEATSVSINAYKWYQPMNFIESIVSISTTPGGANLLNVYPFGFQCSSTACQATGSTLLSAGTYYYSVKKYPNDSGFYTDGLATLKVSKQIPLPSFAYPIGGCRVVSIVHADSSGNTMMKRYRYTDRYDSVGYFNNPHYLSKMDISVNNGNPSCVRCGLQTIISEENVKPMSGNPVEYLYVTEYTDENGSNGETQYSFTRNENLSEGSGPYLSPFKTNWKAGLLKNKKQFRRNGTAMELVQLDSTDFVTIDLSDGVTRGIKSQYSDYCSISGLGFRYYSYQTAVYRSELFNTRSQSQVYYDGGGKITSASENVFGSTKHTLPTEIRSVSSSGDSLREKIKYSFDYDTATITGNDAKAIRLLQRKNILVPVEKLSIKKVGAVEYVTQATLFTYKTDTAVLDKVFELPLAAPALYSGFAGSTITGGNLTKDNRYEEVARFVKYDNNLNVLQMQSASNINKSYYWDYDQQYVVCEVIDAPQTEIAYSSFETSNNTGWVITSAVLDSSVAFTGRRCINPNAGNLVKNNLTNGKQYLLSYWSRAGAKTISGASGTLKTGVTINGWTYYEHLLTTSSTTVTVSGSGLLDELRLYPAGAQMNTFTYAPLIGITSQCDARNNVSYFEYDSIGRLLHIRDSDRSILKKFEYLYYSATGL